MDKIFLLYVQGTNKFSIVRNGKNYMRPNELNANQVFATAEDAQDWAKANGYSDYFVESYEMDIEDEII